MSARKAIWQSAKIFHSKDFAGSDWLQSLGLSFTTNWRIFQIWYWCKQYTGNLTMDILSQQHRKEMIFQARFAKIIRDKTWDRLSTNCLCRRSYTLQIWKDVKDVYCAFPKHANSEVQSRLHNCVIRLAIIITITSNEFEPWHTETPKTDRNPMCPMWRCRNQNWWPNY